MKSSLAEFPNERADPREVQRIQTFGATDRRLGNSAFETLGRGRVEEDLPEHFGLSVIYLQASWGGGYCEKDKYSLSKHNNKNVSKELDLILLNHKLEAMAASDITVITPYADQTNLDNQTFDEVRETMALARPRRFAHTIKFAYIARARLIPLSIQ